MQIYDTIYFHFKFKIKSIVFHKIISYFNRNQIPPSFKFFAMFAIFYLLLYLFIIEYYIFKNFL